MIAKIEPDSGRIGDIITISGSSFGLNRDTSFISFNNIKAIEYTSWNDTLIKVKVPAGTISGKVWVKTKELKSNEMAFKLISGGNASSDTVKIGNQIWMSKNLDVDHYQNGDSIPHVTDLDQWKNMQSGAWCYYNNDPGMGKIYGKIYNAYAIIDNRGLAPKGWRVANNNDWATLDDFLGGETIAGGKAKESGFLHWLSPNTGATNESGLSMLPGGMRHFQNDFVRMGTFGYYWSTTVQTGPKTYWSWSLQNDRNDVIWGAADATSGFYVRCVRNN